MIKTVRQPAETYWNYFGNKLVELAAIDKGATVLDVGTGGGSSLFPALETVGTSGQVIGIDISYEWMKETSDKIKTSAVHNAHVMQMDVGNLGFEDNTFDYVLSGFIGWDDWFDFAQCEVVDSTHLEEIYRVLKDGGRIGLSSWALQEENEFMSTLVRRYLLAKPGGKNRIPLNYSKETAEGLEKMLFSAGFENMNVLTETADIVYRDEQHWWKCMQTIGWQPHVEEVKNAGKLEDLKKDVGKGLQNYRTADSIHFVKQVLFSFGTKSITY
jgi:ubiquinone/menaquinone biosynthesis C-methylase UbiE